MIDRTNILLSIVIPIYKVEQYIGKCLNSIYGQIDDLPVEVVLVLSLIHILNGFTYHSEGISGYQIGNKFYLCYSNIFLATVYLLRYPLELKNHLWYIKILLLVTFLLSIKTGCSTMIIGTLFYYMLTFVVKGEKLQFLRCV